MENDCIRQEKTSIFFHSRKEAAKQCQRRYSGKGAAEVSGVSPSAVADYEPGNTKVAPVDKVDRCPERRTLYCWTECPVGKRMPAATRVDCLESVSIRFLKEFVPDRLKDIRTPLIEIADDGKVGESEKPEFHAVLAMTDDLSRILSELRLIGEKP